MRPGCNWQSTIAECISSHPETAHVLSGQSIMGRKRCCNLKFQNLFKTLIRLLDFATIRMSGNPSLPDLQAMPTPGQPDPAILTRIAEQGDLIQSRQRNSLAVATIGGGVGVLGGAVFGAVVLGARLGAISGILVALEVA